MEFCMKRGELSIYLCGMNLIVRLSSTLVYEWVYATRQKEYINVYIIIIIKSFIWSLVYKYNYDINDIYIILFFIITSIIQTHKGIHCVIILNGGPTHIL